MPDIEFSESETVVKNLRDFKPRNSISQEFKEYTKSRSLFVNHYEEIGSQINLSGLNDCVTTDPHHDQESNDEATTILGSPSENNNEKDIENGITTRVHIENLIPPSGDRCVRRLYHSHVRDLKGKFATRQMQTKILAGVLVKGTLKEAEKEGACEIETIGGNHTRAAIQELYQEGKWQNPYFLVQVFSGISNHGALKVGLTHNLIDQDAAEMTFMEKTRVIRTIKQGNPRWSNAAKDIFGYKSNKETLVKLRTMSAVADLDTDLWSRLCQIDSQWKEKKPLKQTAFTAFVTLNREKKSHLIKVWEEKGYQSYISCVKKEVAERKTGNEEATTIQKNILNQNKTLKEKVSSLEAENEDLKSKLNEQDLLIEDLRNKLKQASNSAEKENEDVEEIIQCGLTKDGISQSRKRKLQEDLPNHSLSEKQKKNEKTNDGQLCVNKDKCLDGDNLINEPAFKEGDRVWAYYAPYKTSYPARILNYNHKKNKYEVEYEEDKIKKTLGVKDLVKY